MQNMFFHLFLTESERVFVMFAAVAIIMLQSNLYDLNLGKTSVERPSFQSLNIQDLLEYMST